MLDLWLESAANSARRPGASRLFHTGRAAHCVCVQVTGFWIAGFLLEMKDLVVAACVPFLVVSYWSRTEPGFHLTRYVLCSGSEKSSGQRYRQRKGERRERERERERERVRER